VTRRFVIVGSKARASPDFLLVDIPSTSGRLDVLLRCLRAALLVSHGLRRDTVVYLLLLGDPEAPATLRIDGAAARYLRPDERSLATVIKKALAVLPEHASFTAVRPGISIARGGIDALLPELTGSALHVLDENGTDLRAQPLSLEDVTFFLGDHTGFDDATRARLAQLATTSLRVGPQSLHAEDVIGIVHNELDRRVGTPA
jgi:tRNA (pseudouridine54-N1)-methyltransferase